MSDVNEFNIEVGEEVLRSYTTEELKQKEIDATKSVAPESIPLPENNALISALTKLQSLGLTTDEAKAIVGL